MRSLTIALALLAAPLARADELSTLLEVGPLVRMETHKDGKLREALAIADVNASADEVWRVLNDFEAYRSFMPRMKELKVSKQGNDSLLEITLDTPFMATRYTNRMTPDIDKRVLRVANVSGDLSGTRFTWRVVALGDRARIYHSGIVKNFSSVAESMEDESQSITIGVNVASLLQAIKAIKDRTESIKGPLKK